MNKTILITGSTDGIGKLVAFKLAKAGHVIYLHGRNAEKLEKVVAEIKTDANNQKVKGFVADFTDMEAVKTMATKVNEEVLSLDVLINNAGVYKSLTSKTKDKVDIRFAVNYFAPVLLTQELLPLLKKGNSARIINLSSAAQAPVSMTALTGKEDISTQAAYAQSKLALTMWSFHLADSEPDLTVIPVNPGSLLNTKMVKEGWGFHRSSADVGRDILYDLTILDKYQNASGRYFDNDRGTFGSIHPAGNDKDAINTLVQRTNEWLNR